MAVLRLRLALIQGPHLAWKGAVLSPSCSPIAGLGIGCFGLDALHAVSDHRRRAELKPELHLPAQAVLRQHGISASLRTAVKCSIAST